MPSYGNDNNHLIIKRIEDLIDNSKNHSINYLAIIIKTCMGKVHEENYENLQRDIKKDLDKWRCKPFFSKKLNIVGMRTLSNLFLR